MKKSLIALAVAGAMTAPMVAQADATLYGSMRIHAGAGEGKELDISNDVSRIGIKGSIDTSIDGVKAIYQLESIIGEGDYADGATQNEATFGLDGRLAYVGLTGGFGTVVMGQMWTPLYTMVTGVTDMTINETGETSSYLRTDSTVAYITPMMGGFQMAAAVVADANAESTGFKRNDGEDADHYELTAKYAANGFTVGLGAHEAAADAGTDVLALSGSYTMDALTIAALYQDKSNDVKGTDSTNPYELAGSYTMGATKLIATYYDQDNAADTTGYNLEIQHKLGAQATIYANYNDDDSDVASSDGDAYGVGLRVDF